MRQVIDIPKGGPIARVVAVISAHVKERPTRVTIEEAKSRRSDQQNRYLWGICYATLLQHLPGWDAEDVHEYFLGEHFGWETLDGLGKKRMKPIRRSSKLSTAEFSDFVGFVQRKAADMGIYLPDPE